MLARVDRQEEWEGGLMAGRLTLQVARLEQACDGVITMTLADARGDALPLADPGAHLDLHLPNGLTRQYSIIAVTPAGYELGVQKDAASRGGSSWLHDNARVGMRLETSGPRNHFALERAGSYVFIAGGIGITPILSMVRAARAQGLAHHLFYCTRDAARTAFLDELAGDAHRDSVTIVHDNGDPARGLDIAAAVSSPAAGARLYCCGPAGLMDAVRSTALAAGWPAERLHFENFTPVQQASGEDRPFTVVVSSTGEELHVAADRSILEVLTEAGYIVDSACEDGICGTCQVGVIEGAPDHRDSVLSDAQRAAGNVMQVCCSRAAGDRLVLDI